MLRRSIQFLMWRSFPNHNEFSDTFGQFQKKFEDLRFR